ncbi:MAG: glycosyltransferase [Clostridia bacterium]|nr:glycosyltransferase [Clostridia bacterium]
MTISVIIPAYNCSAFLSAIIGSIYQSGLKDFEIVAVNDGSTDGTGAVLNELSGRFPELRVIDQANGGVSSARNRGLSEAKGEYVLFVDADDSMEPGSLEGVNAILEREMPDMLLFGMSFDYYLKSKLYRSDEYRSQNKRSMDAETAANSFEELFQNNMLSPVWNKLIKRELIASNGIKFREDMIEMEDYLFSVRCLSKCSSIYLLDRAVYRYRQAEDERSTFNRLRRIGSLSHYVEPFYEAADWFSRENGASERVLRVADAIYSGLFHEQIRFSSLKQVRAAAEDMLSGTHSRAIAASDPKLYTKLEKKRYASVRLKCSLNRARHWLAVRMKYMKTFGRVK